jgi:hypothetical protein
LTTTVSVTRAAAQTPYGEALELAITTASPADIGAAVLDGLDAIPLKTGKERAARDAAVAAIKQALDAFGRNTSAALEAAIVALADAGGGLEELANPKAEQVRAGIGQLLKQAQWRWSRTQP